MNRISKGAVAVGLGVVLLLGGGGTFAYWNASVASTGGTIAAGNLDLKANGAGIWTDRNGAAVDITSYKVVPGDLLTYTQKLDVTLVGNKIAANLTVDAPASSGTFTATNIKTGVITLKDGSGNAVTNPLRASASGLTATTTFEFLSSTVNRDDVNATYDFSKVAFKLQQIQQSGLQ